MESRKGLFSWLTFMLMNILMHIFTLREAFASLASLVSADFFWETLCWGELINYHFTCQEDLFRELILARKLVLGEQLVWAKNDLGGTSFWAEYDFFWEIFVGLFERESDLLQGTVTSGAAFFGEGGKFFKVCLAGCLPDTVQSSHGFLFWTSRKLGVELQHIALRLKSNWGLFKWGEFLFFLSSNWWKVEVDWNTVCFFSNRGGWLVSSSTFWM